MLVLASPTITPPTKRPVTQPRVTEALVRTHGLHGLHAPAHDRPCTILNSRTNHCYHRSLSGGHPPMACKQDARLPAGKKAASCTPIYPTTNSSQKHGVSPPRYKYPHDPPRILQVLHSFDPSSLPQSLRSISFLQPPTLRS